MQTLEMEEDNNDMCKMCKFCWLDESESPDTLITPCQCEGTCAYVHQSCLTSWIKERGNSHCQFCTGKYEIDFKKTPKSVFQWIRSSDSLRSKLLFVFATVLVLACLASTVASFRTPENMVGKKSDESTVYQFVSAVCMIVFALLVLSNVRSAYKKWSTANFNIQFA